MKKRDIKAKLLGKFKYVADPKSKHDGVTFFYSGTMVAATQFSRGAGPDIDDQDLLSQMAKEVGVFQLGFFKDMISCKKSYDDYVEKLRERGWV
jgi:hypothetical protein